VTTTKREFGRALVWWCEQVHDVVAGAKPFKSANLNPDKKEGWKEKEKTRNNVLLLRFPIHY
jgi:hypothetical protein